MSREILEFSKDIDEHFDFSESLFDELVEMVLRWIN